MKKLIAVAFLSVAGLAVVAGRAPAWFCCHHCANKCCTTICCQPYNAFTPICCGNINCMGCCPMSCGGCGAAPCGPYSGGPFCAEGSCGLGGGQLPAVDGTNGGWAGNYQGPVYQGPAPQGPSLPAPTFQGPMPTPAAQNGPISYNPSAQMWPNSFGMPGMPGTR